MNNNNMVDYFLKSTYNFTENLNILWQVMLLMHQDILNID